MIRELFRRNAPLAWGGLICLVLLLVAVAGSLVDDRVVTGLNVWFKPIKFAASITIYLWTLAWFVEYLKEFRPKAVRRLSRAIAVVMVLEYLLVFVQAARGVTSHFNNSTPVDGLIFAAMGILILLNTVFLVILTALFFLHRPRVPDAYLWGIRLGLVLFLVFSVEGALMVSQNGHAVGAPDDVPGLPFLGWSRMGGDLRYAHFIGMHALQLLPLVGWFASGRRQKSAVPIVLILAAAHFALAWWTMQTALAGIPIIP